MEPLQSGQVLPPPIFKSGIITPIIFTLVGFALGYSLITSYFLFLVPKPAPVTIEKIVEKTVLVQVPSASVSSVPGRVYDFYVVKDTGNASTTSDIDKAIIETVSSLLKKDKDVDGALSTTTLEIVVSGDLGFVSVEASKSAVGTVNFVIDIKNKKVLDRFTSYVRYSADKGTLIFGNANDADGLRYYMYGASSSVKILNSSLSGGQSYTEYYSENGANMFELVSTTTNSVTFGVFDKTETVSTQGGGTPHYRKTGERMFIIP